MKRLLVLFMLLMPLTAWAGFNVFGGGSGGITPGSDAVLGTLTADSTIVSGVSRAGRFEKSTPTYWELFTKEVVADTIGIATAAHELELRPFGDFSLAARYARHWQMKSVASADSDSCRVGDTDVPISIPVDSCSVWLKPSSTTKLSARLIIKTGATTILNQSIIMTSTNWTQYKFELSADFVENQAYMAYFHFVLDDAETLLFSNPIVW